MSPFVSTLDQHSVSVSNEHTEERKKERKQSIELQLYLKKLI